jgi:hypothetical protein
MLDCFRLRLRNDVAQNHTVQSIAALLSRFISHIWKFPPQSQLSLFYR